MTQISKSKAAQIAGMHEKTLERHIKNPDFQAATGYVKNAMNGRVAFDEQKFRSYLAGAGVDVSEQTGASNDTSENIIDAEILNAENKLVRVSGNTDNAEQAIAVVQLIDHLAKHFTANADTSLIPHKLYLTLDEAKALTGFPKTALAKYSELKHGRRVIKRSKLEKI